MQAPARLNSAPRDAPMESANARPSDEPMHSARDTSVPANLPVPQ